MTIKTIDTKVVTQRMFDEFCMADTNINGLIAALDAAPEAARVRVDAHPDDIAVDRFAAAMKEKLANKRAQGYGGWDDKEKCSAERLQKLLIDHLAKGDPVDIGNFAMMLWNRGEPVKPAPVEREPFAWTYDVDGLGEVVKDCLTKHEAHAKLWDNPRPLYLNPLDPETRRMVLDLCNEIREHVHAWSLIGDAENILEKLGAA